MKVKFTPIIIHPSNEYTQGYPFCWIIKPCLSVSFIFFRKYSLKSTASFIGPPQRQVARSLKALCLALLQGLERLLDALLEDERDFARKMMAIIKKNTVRFLDIAEELPQVRV
jgi:hypothetical protein